jgi:hypothetical protein
VQKITKDAAEHAVEKLCLGEKNRAFAGYWLSLWQGDALPEQARFDLGQIKALAPGAMIFEVLPARRVTVGYAGADVCRAVGEQLTGIDWVARSVVRNRGVRMRNLSAVATGSLMICRRTFRMPSGRLCANEELVVPFAAKADGTHQAIALTDWKIDGTDGLASITEIADAAHYNILALRRRRPPSREMEAA